MKGIEARKIRRTGDEAVVATHEASHGTIKA